MTPAYNQAAHIEAALTSVLSQDLPDWELIVVDDGSTDRTAELVAQVRDSRVQLISQANSGVCAARNVALARCRGEYVAFLDADDLFFPAKLAAQTSFMDEHSEIGLTYTSRIEIDQHGRRLGFVPLPSSASLEDFVLGFPFAPTDLVVRRSWVETVGPFSAGFVINEDREWFIRLGLAGCRCAGLGAYLSVRRLNATKVFRDLPARLDDMCRSLQAAFDDPRCPSAVLARRNEAHRIIHVEWGYQSAVQGDARFAAQCFTRALELDPALLADGGDAMAHALVAAAARDGGNHEVRLVGLSAALPSAFECVRARLQRGLADGHFLRGLSAAVGGGAEAARDHFAQLGEAADAPSEVFLHDAVGQLRAMATVDGEEAAARALAICVGGLESSGRTARARWLAGHYAFNAALSHDRTGHPLAALSELGQAWRAHPAFLGNRGAWSLAVRASGRVLTGGGADLPSTSSQRPA